MNWQLIGMICLEIIKLLLLSSVISNDISGISTNEVDVVEASVELCTTAYGIAFDASFVLVTAVSAILLEVTASSAILLEVTAESPIWLVPTGTNGAKYTIINVVTSERTHATTTMGITFLMEILP